MKLADAAFLADGNTHPAVVAHMRRVLPSVSSALGSGLGGASDQDVPARAAQVSRVVVMHDAGVGALAHLHGTPAVGSVFLRPGHTSASFTIGARDAVVRWNPEVSPPAMLVAKRYDDRVSMRLSRL